MTIHVERNPTIDGHTLDHAVLITIDRPGSRNSLDLYHFRDLAGAWRDLRFDDDLWLAIVTGVPGNFMSGRTSRPTSPR